MTEEGLWYCGVDTDPCTGSSFILVAQNRTSKQWWWITFPLFPSVVFQKRGGLGDCFLLSLDVVLDARPAYLPQAFASCWRDTNYLITLP